MEPRETEAGPISAQMAESLIAKVTRFEREHGRLKRTNRILSLSLAATAAIALAALFIAGIGSSDVVEASQILLTDANGVVRGQWSVQENGATALALQDRNGIARLRMTVLDGGAPGVALTDARGRSRVVLGVLPDETSTLVFADGEGTTRTVLGVTPNGGANLVFADGVGATRAEMGVGNGGAPVLTLYEDARAAPPPVVPEPEPDTTGSGG